jgi:hypothetical protein
LERVILRLHHEAVPAVEISRRLGKKPGTVNRILQMIDFKQGRDLKPAGRDGLRPIERVVLRLRAAGESYGEIGNRLGRSGAQIRRIEGYAHFKA